MFNEYKNAGGVIIDDIIDAFYGVVGNWLNWLEFNIRRSLGEDINDNAEQQLGIEQVNKTLAILQYLTNNIETWVTMIKNL